MIETTGFARMVWTTTIVISWSRSWNRGFLADKSALNAFYGQQFQAAALPGNQEVEHISKADVLGRLDRATKKTEKGPYRKNKGSHSFMILATINPTEVESRAPAAKVLLDVLRAGGPSSE